VLLSAVVVGELMYGFRRGAKHRRNVTELREFVADPHVEWLPVTLDTADRYARIASALRDRGTPIPSNDIWIAAHAMEHGADLISFDAHFELVAGLAWVNPEA
jgi:predicted nucleic acid-binding protein